MFNLSSLIITLTPQDNARLQALCGAFDENIQLIEKAFSLEIARRNFTFTLKSNEQPPKPHHEKLLSKVAALIQRLYLETAPVRGVVKEIDLSDVHLAIQENRMLLQDDTEQTEQNAVPKVYQTTIKTKRGLIKPRGANQIQYLHNILRHDICFGIDLRERAKPF